MSLLIKLRGVKVASSVYVYLKPLEWDNISAQVLANVYSHKLYVKRNEFNNIIEP
jgi:hypothetical protein